MQPTFVLMSGRTNDRLTHIIFLSPFVLIINFFFDGKTINYAKQLFGS